MKILHLIFSEQVGGAEKYLLNLLPALCKENIDCELILVTPKKSKIKFTGFCTEMEQKGVKTLMITGNKYNFVSIAGKIGKYLKQNNIRFLHTHLFKSDILAVIVKKFYYKNIFLISTKHGYQEKYFIHYHNHKGKINYDLYYFISKYLGHNFNENLTISRAMSDLYFNLKLTPTRMHYIHHGIDLPISSFNENPGEFKSAVPQLIIAGRIEKIKGHQFLLEAMPKVKEAFPDVKLIVIGNGSQKIHLASQVSRLGIGHTVSFLGFQQDPYAFIAASDILVLPSLYEPFGLVFIEAFALKAPVIAFDVPAANELISPDETGILVPVHDINSLAQKIIYLLNNSAERQRLAQNAYIRYTSHFHTARMIGEIVNWYNSLLT